MCRLTGKPEHYKRGKLTIEIRLAVIKASVIVVDNLTARKIYCVL